jgi:hypothetical protein
MCTVFLVIKKETLAIRECVFQDLPFLLGMSRSLILRQADGGRSQVS